MKKNRTYLQWIVIILILFCPWSYSQNSGPLDQKTIDNLLKDLDRWPLREAQAAVRTITKNPGGITPFLLLKLKEGTPQAREACAFCLGKIKSSESFDNIVEAAQDLKMINRLNTLFTALIQIDRDKAYPAILKFLQQKNQTSHNYAFNALAAITRPEHFEILKTTFSNTKLSNAKRYIIELISRIESSEAIDFVIESMRDKSALVAYKSAQILGEMNDDNVRRKLLKIVEAGNRRFIGYAGLAIVLQEDNFEKALFDEAWIPKLLGSLRDSDRFVRGSAAVALVNIGFVTSNSDIIQVMNSNLAPVLIDSVMGKSYYNDYYALKNLAYTKLKQLTGKDLPFSGTAWWEWWHQQGKNFRAVRALRGVSPEQVISTTIHYHAEGTFENQKILLIADPEAIENYKEERKLVVLSIAEITRFLNMLKEVDFFDLEPIYGEKLPNTPIYNVTIKVKNLVKKVTCYETMGPLHPVVDRIETLVQDNVWQEYWDSYHFPNWQQWYQRNKVWFEENPEASLRMIRIKNMIINSYGWVKEEKRTAAVEHFLELMKINKELSDISIDLALLHLRTELEMDYKTECWIRGLASSEKLVAITKIVEFLLKNYHPKLRTLLNFTVDRAPKDLVMQYLKHPSPNLRSAAAEISAKYTDDELVAIYLTGMLRDENILVRQSAIYALGKLKVKKVSETLTEFIEDEQEKTDIKRTAMAALARIEGTNSLSVLLDQLSKNDSETRASVAIAMAEIGGKASIQTLIALMIGDPAPNVRTIAANSLASFDSKYVIRPLLKVAFGTYRTDAKVAALDVLKRCKAERALPKVLKLLKSSDDEISTAAAFFVAEFSDKRAVPVLIASLDHPTRGLSCRRQLERLTLVEFPGERSAQLKSRYEDWWRLNGELSTKQWFFDAVRKRGYNGTVFVDYLLGDVKPKEMIPMLLKILKREDWFLQAKVCQILEKFTKKNHGEISYITGKQTRAKVVQDWHQWWESEGSK